MASIILDMSDFIDAETGLADPDRLAELLEGLELRFDQCRPDNPFDLEFTGSEEDIYRLVGRVAESDGVADALCAGIRTGRN